jgi:hypothetical protein
MQGYNGDILDIIGYDIYIYNINMYLYMYIILYNTMHIKVCPDGYKLHNWYIIGIYGYTRYI